MELHDMPQRPRRNRRTPAIRALLRETRLRAEDLVWPLFVVSGEGEEQPIEALPGCARLGPDRVVEAARRGCELGIRAVALFPVLPESHKDARGSRAADPEGLLPRTVRRLAEAVPEMTVITDVALDPYSSDGRDGLLVDGEVQNDETLPLLAQMAVTQADAGAHYVAPSDMMDGRVGVIREALDRSGHGDVGILSYAAKYASALYGPFRSALDSAPRSGDKRGYQMDPANAREALRELALDVEEGADIVMVKPALAYLDVVQAFAAESPLPVAAYHVSGEYAMVMAAGRNGWIDADAVLHEHVLSIKRAGADLIFTYAAPELARRLA